MNSEKHHGKCNSFIKKTQYKLKVKLWVEVKNLLKFTYSTKPNCDALRHSLSCRALEAMWGKMSPMPETPEMWLWQVKWSRQASCDWVRRAWLVTTPQPVQAARLRGTDFWHLAGLKRISIMSDSSTYSIPTWNIKACVIHREAKRLQAQFFAGLCPWSRRLCLRQWSRPWRTVSSFSLLLCCHFLGEWDSALCLMPGQIHCCDYVLGWNQITRRCHTRCSESSLCFSLI